MKSPTKSLLSILLAMALLVCSIPVSSALSLTMGDINSDSGINAADALLALQYSVQLRSMTLEEKSMADVNADGKINASDALLILQHSVGLIDEFVNQGNKVNLDLYYGVDGSDFTEVQTISNINDSKEVIDKLGGTNEASEVEEYELDDFGYLVYNPISSEAKKTGNLNKYDNASKVSGTLEVDGITVEYSMPTDITAYDAVPITYTASGEGDVPLYVEAVAFEEADRTNGNDYYDLNIPGIVDVDITFDGYVTASYNNGYKPNLSGIRTDKQGTQYPSFDATELTRSGNIKAEDLTWMKFSYTNVGNTILDGDGNGTFCFQPLLYKKNSDGTWDKVCDTENLFERVYDYFYPGETGEMYVNFVNRTYTPGEYRIVINCLVRNERGSGPNWGATIWGGYIASSSSFEFIVDNTGEVTQPAEVIKDPLTPPSRNNWLGTYEEFMSSYQTIPYCTSPVSRTMYIQPAPWTEEIVLKVMTGTNYNLSTVRIPVNVETDSIKVYLNEDNDNYVVEEDGTRTPVIAAQTMADMRSNVARGPDCATTIVNDLLDMKEAGINWLSTTIAFGYDTGRNASSYAQDANKFMLDVARVLGFSVEGYSSYPYANAVGFATSIGASISANTSGWSDANLDIANAYCANYTYNRYGDLLWQAADGIIPITTEDTRGWMRIDIPVRYYHGSATELNFGQWLKSKYPTIKELNEAYGYGADYINFESIRVSQEASNSADANYGSGLTYDNQNLPFHDWTTAMTDFDLYRTVERANNYKNILDNLETSVTSKYQGSTLSNTKITLRTEGANWMVAGIDPDTTNSHYRHVYYSQRRCAMVAEIMQSSGTTFGHSDYTTLPYSPSEVYELTKMASEQGIVEFPLAQFNRMRDIAINPLYGTSLYTTEYNLTDDGMTKGAYISTCTALFPWFKAVYEGGGVPGILWQDYLCDGMATSTQYKEIKFYKEKIEEMLATEEGTAWAENFEKLDQSWRDEVGAWSYPEEYVESVVANTKRNCIFEGLYQ